MTRTFLILALVPLAACTIKRDTLMQDPVTGRQAICYADVGGEGISDHDVCIHNLKLKGWVIVKNRLAY